ncbi:MAG: HigA family addiction module antitoxin [Desulfococcaceae bacterium]
MTMYNPPHPGEFVYFTYMEPFGLSCRFLASKLGVAPSTLNRILKKQSGISPEMALRLSAVLGRSPESWLALQDAYDLRQAKQRVKLSGISKLEFNMA